MGVKLSRSTHPSIVIVEEYWGGRGVMVKGIIDNSPEIVRDSSGALDGPQALSGSHEVR